MKSFLENSIVVRLSVALAEAAEHSRAVAMWKRIFGREDPAAHSVYQEFLCALQCRLERFGSVLRSSLTWACIESAGQRLSSAGHGSRIVAPLLGVPFHRWFLLLFALYLPVEYAIRNVFHLAAVASVWEEALIALGMMIVLVRAAMVQKHKETGRVSGGNLAQGNATEAAILLFMAVGLLLMMLNRPFPAVALTGYRAQVQYMVWFFFILRLIDDRKDAAVLYGAFTGTVLLMCAHGIYQYAIGVEIPANWVTQTEMGVRTRVFSLTGSPNIFGSLIVMAAPMSAACVYYFRSIRWKVLAFFATGIACLCILFTFSRGAWVGLVVAVIVFALFIDRRLLAVMAAAVAGILVAVPSITNRLTYLFTSDYAEASAIGGRALRWQLGRDLLMENSPLLGFGLGRFGGAVAMNNQLLDETETFRYFYMDNYYLKTLVEMGYIGLFFFALLLATLVISGFRAAERSGRGFRADRRIDPLVRNSGNVRMLTTGILSGLIGVLAHCFFENIFEEPYMMAYFWGLAALMIALGSLSESPDAVSVDDCAA